MKWSTVKIRAWMEQRPINSKFLLQNFLIHFIVYLSLSAVTSEQQIK